MSVSFSPFESPFAILKPALRSKKTVKKCRSSNKQIVHFTFLLSLSCSNFLCVFNAAVIFRFLSIFFAVTFLSLFVAFVLQFVKYYPVCSS